MKKERITELTASILIDQNQEVVWNVVKKFGDISDFHPLVKSSFRTNKLTGLGAKRYCKLLPMGAMDEEIIEWNEGTGFTAEVFDGKMLPPCRFMKGKLQLEDVEGQTRVTFTFSYQMKFGILGAIVNRLLIKPQFAKAPPQYVKGLKDYMESSLL